MIIDCHGHYTTAPQALREWRDAQVAALNDPAAAPWNEPLEISDDQIRETLEKNQLKKQKDRGIDLALFSPGAGRMAHHVGNARTSEDWSRQCNDLIWRACQLFPDSFIGVAQLPQSPGVEPRNCIPELERVVSELGFVGVNLNPDPTGAYWTDPPLTDRWWYPLYEKLCELQVPAMIHVASSCNPNFHGTGAHYLAGDTTAFMQILESNLFRDFPDLKFVIPHGGGAVPYHWGRYRGLALDRKLPPLEEIVLDNVFFDTCVYHQPGVSLLTEVIPAENVLFASEMIGAVKGIDPLTGHFFDDTKRYVDGSPWLDDTRRKLIFEGNARRVYPRLDAELKRRGM
jgi:4-oxalmesaconate hydratase